MPYQTKPPPHNPTPKNPQIWTELWARASQEEIGIAISVENPNLIISYLGSCRPAGFEDYTICRTEDQNTLFIVRPGVTLDV